MGAVTCGGVGRLGMEGSPLDGVLPRSCWSSGFRSRYLRSAGGTVWLRFRLPERQGACYRSGNRPTTWKGRPR